MIFSVASKNRWKLSLLPLSIVGIALVEVTITVSVEWVVLVETLALRLTAAQHRPDADESHSLMHTPANAIDWPIVP